MRPPLLGGPLVKLGPISTIAPSRVGHTKKLFYNKMNFIYGFGKYNFFVCIGYLEGAQDAPDLILAVGRLGSGLGS